MQISQALAAALAPVCTSPAAAGQGSRGLWAGLRTPRSAGEEPWAPAVDAPGAPATPEAMETATIAHIRAPSTRMAGVRCEPRAWLGRDAPAVRRQSPDGIHPRQFCWQSSLEAPRAGWAHLASQTVSPPGQSAPRSRAPPPRQARLLVRAVPQLAPGPPARRESQFDGFLAKMGKEKKHVNLVGESLRPSAGKSLFQ